jgi:hypothetical protein
MPATHAHARTATVALWLTALIIGTAPLLRPTGEFTASVASAGHPNAAQAVAWVRPVPATR